MDDRHEPSLYLQTQELTSALLADQAFEPEGILESITCDGSCHDFYMMIFSAQRAWNRPKYTHTFATFVKATSRPGGMLSRPLSKSPSGAESPGRQSMAGERHLLESHTISWLAAKKKGLLVSLLARARQEFRSDHLSGVGSLGSSADFHVGTLSNQARIL